MTTTNEPNLMSIAERIARLNNEKKEVEEMIKEVYAEAKSTGFDPKILKRAIRFMEMDETDRKKYKDEETVLYVYLQQLALPL
jgi:uncharacterized protein (UPF0335 family)